MTKKSPQKKRKSPATDEPFDPYGPDIMKVALDAEGITPSKLAAYLNAELEAEETKFFQDEGKVTDWRNVIAWGVRQKARMDAQKLLGLYPAESLKIGNENGQPFQLEEVGATKELLYSQIARLVGAGKSSKKLDRKPRRKPGAESAI